MITSVTVEFRIHMRGLDRKYYWYLLVVMLRMVTYKPCCVGDETKAYGLERFTNCNVRCFDFGGSTELSAA